VLVEKTESGALLGIDLPKGSGERRPCWPNANDPVYNSDRWHGVPQLEENMSFRISFFDELIKAAGPYSDLDRRYQQTGAYQKLEQDEAIEALARKRVEGHHKKLQEMQRSEQEAASQLPQTDGGKTPEFMGRLQQNSNLPPGADAPRAEAVAQESAEQMQVAASTKLAAFTERWRQVKFAAGSPATMDDLKAALLAKKKAKGMPGLPGPEKMKVVRHFGKRS